MTRKIQRLLDKIAKRVKENENKHVCGSQGYGYGLNDSCPACEKQNKYHKIIRVDEDVKMPSLYGRHGIKEKPTIR
jgi:hypothetical protein